jgi:hypothetical protein
VLEPSILMVVEPCELVETGEINRLEAITALPVSRAEILWNLFLTENIALVVFNLM